MNRNRTMTFLLGVALAAAAGPIHAGNDRTGTCVVAEVPQTIVLPDGRAVEGGWVRICFSRRYSPVSGLHETSVDGRAAGMFASDRRISEGLGTHGDAFLVLRRIDDDTLALYAYAIRAGDRMVTYRLRDPKRGRGDASPGPEPEPAVGTLLADSPSGFVVIAAR